MLVLWHICTSTLQGTTNNTMLHVQKYYGTFFCRSPFFSPSLFLTHKKPQRQTKTSRCLYLSQSQHSFSNSPLISVEKGVKRKASEEFKGFIRVQKVEHCRCRRWPRRSGLCWSFFRRLSQVRLLWTVKHTLILSAHTWLCVKHKERFLRTVIFKKMIHGEKYTDVHNLTETHCVFYFYFLLH